MYAKLKVGIIYGGESFEHEVSKMTAKSILDNIDREKFEVSEIYITRDGKVDAEALKSVDVAFLAAHGPNCEDGKLQSKLEEIGVKYTGADIESSRLNMDKIRQHEVFGSLDLNTTKYIVVHEEDFPSVIARSETTKQSIEKIATPSARNDNSNKRLNEIHTDITDKFGYPCFVKPNNGGSSVGTTKVNSRGGLAKALEEAFKCDDSVIIEEAIDLSRELEVAVLGNEELIVSEPGEILGNGEFYSYDTKYFHPFDTATLAKLDKTQVVALQSQAEKAYRGTGCTGYARVDFFLDKSGTIYINEINTLPGFTKISMFPKMMDACGIPYKELITKIIELALQ